MRRIIYPPCAMPGSAGTSTLANTSQSTVYFSDNFESGTLLTTDVPAGKWDTASPNAAISTLAAHRGTYGVNIHYAGTAPVDANDYLYKTGFSQRHLFTRGYVKFIRNTEPDSTYRQRKLIWWQDELGGQAYTWAAFIVAWEKLSPTRLTLMAGANEGPSGDNFAHYFDNTSLNFNTWYCIEMEIQLNTPGAHVNDGIYRIWIDGTEINYEGNDNTHVAWTGTNTSPMQSFRLGEQLDCGPANSDENRYWDDIVVADSYIGV